MSDAPAFVREVQHALSAGRNVALHAPTGAGKSTLLPAALLADPIAEAGVIYLVEPRRVAARAVARRVAELRGSALGGEVGYDVRFDRKVSSNTRLVVVTDGMLLRRLQNDPLLDGVSAILFDEFHERSLSMDLCVAFAREAQREVRPDLRIVAMSATFDVETVGEFLDADVVQTEGRAFPVDVEYRGKPSDDEAALHRALISASADALAAVDGDVLVFLPGAREIERAARALENAGELRGIEVLRVYGAMQDREQDRIFSPGSRRRVILATNIAETSLTIPRVHAVVDSGLVKRMRFDPGTGFNRLRLEYVSRDSARQRAGRAGRLAPGRCYRLWSETEHLRLDEHESPEIARVELSGALLEVYRWGANPESFAWMEPPPEAAAKVGRELLEALKLIDESGLSADGELAAALPVSPRLARVLLDACRAGVAERACEYVAVLESARTYRSDERGFESDLEVARRQWRRMVREGHPGARMDERVCKQLSSQLRQLCAEGAAPGDPDDALRSSLVAGFPDRIAKRRKPGEALALSADGRGLVLAKWSDVRRSPWFVALDIDARDAAESFCRQAVGLSDADVAPYIRDEQVYRFNEMAGRVEVLDVRHCGAIILREQTSPQRDPSRVADVLADAALQRLDKALGLKEPATAQWLARYRFVAEHVPELELPALDDALWRQVVFQMALGANTFRELQKGSVKDAIIGVIGWQKGQRIDELAPERIEVPSGSRVRLDWSGDSAPVLPVRIQEMFGARETPRVLGGRHPVTLHLLAPNQRPQQVTDDLAGFWERTYPEVRKELRARYPKHAWPDDPLSAAPMRGAKRRRK